MADDHIIRVDLEDRMNKELRNPDAMLHYVHNRIKDKELYIIIDEVQLIYEFVGVLNSFLHIDNADHTSQAATLIFYHQIFQRNFVAEGKQYMSIHYHLRSTIQL